jgi:drug/metabolite transporter (DMT)-like permease
MLEWTGPPQGYPSVSPVCPPPPATRSESGSSLMTDTPARPPHANPLPYFAIAFGVFALGCSAIFVRWANAPGPVTGVYRMGLASLALLPLALRRGDRKPWPRRGILFAVLGGASLAVDMALWSTAVYMTKAANATLFANTAPLWVALAGMALFGERLPALFWGGLAITLSGSALVAGADFLVHPTLGWGDLLSLLAGVFYAGYYLSTQFGRRYLGSARYVWLAGVASTVCLLIICLAAGFRLTGYPPQTYLAFAGSALVTQAAGYLAVGYALGHLPASLVSPTMTGQPVVTALLAIPLLGETLTPVQWLGGAVVITGIYLINRAHRDHTAETAA